MGSTANINRESVWFSLFNYLSRKYSLFIYVGVVICLYIVLNILSDRFIFNEEFYYRTLSDQLSIQNIDKLLSFSEKTWWLKYIFQPLYVIFKVLFVMICITTYSIILDVKFTLKNVFKSAILAEFIFVIFHFIYFFNMYINRTTLTLETVANYYPGSILGYIGSENVVTWLHYPLQTLNLFEVFYIFLISLLLSRDWKPNFVESLNIVLPSYGIGLFFWMALVVFLTIQIS